MKNINQGPCSNLSRGNILRLLNTISDISEEETKTKKLLLQRRKGEYVRTRADESPVQDIRSRWK